MHAVLLSLETGEKADHAIPAVRATMENEVPILLAQLRPGRVDRDTGTITSLETQALASAPPGRVPRPNRALSNRELSVGNHSIPVDIDHSTETTALRTRAERAVE